MGSAGTDQPMTMRAETEEGRECEHDKSQNGTLQHSDDKTSLEIMPMLRQIVREQASMNVRLRRFEQKQALLTSVNHSSQLQGNGPGSEGVSGLLSGLDATGPVSDFADIVHSGTRESTDKVARVWLSHAGPSYYIIRGSYHVPEELSIDVFRYVLRRIAQVTQPVAEQLRSLSNFQLADFYPPLPPGGEPRPLPAEDHLSTFVAALLAVIDYGMENAPRTCISRVTFLRVELQAATSQVCSYLRYHRQELQPDEQGVLRDSILSAGNEDLSDAFEELSYMASDLRRRYSNGIPPPSGAGAILLPPKFRRLMCLVDETNAMNLVEITAMQKRQGLQSEPKSVSPTTERETVVDEVETPRVPTTEPTGAKRPLPTSDTRAKDDQGQRQRPRTASPTPTQGAYSSKHKSNQFATSLVIWDTPRGVCAHVWSGGKCPRSNCEFDHSRVHPRLHHRHSTH